MDQLPPAPQDDAAFIIQEHGTPQPEHAINFSLDPGLLDEVFVFTNVTDGHCFSSVVDETHADSAVFDPHPGCLVSYATAGDHLPMEADWTPPEEWQYSGPTFLPGSYPLAADGVNQAVVDEQGPTLLQLPVTSLGSSFQQQHQQHQQPQHPHRPQQQHAHPVTQPITPQHSHSGHKHRWPRQILEKVKDGLACWRCRAGHMGCDKEEPCNRCRNSSEPAAIPCERGLVCVALGRSGICHFAPKSPRPNVPPVLNFAVECIRGARRRRQEVVDRLTEYCRSDPAAAAGNQSDAVLLKVIRAQVKDARRKQGLEECELIWPDDSHREAIISILWELEDNPNAARLLGIGSVANFAALLETASHCEINHGRTRNKMRIVYNALQCLRYCLDAVRLSGAGALPTTNNTTPFAGAADNIHAHCAQANECIVPGIRSLGKYAPRYVEVLTRELFSRHNNWRHNWLLVFYSLCIQGYVRRGLIWLEENRHSRPAEPASSARRHLQQAVRLFMHISERGTGKLGKKIRDSRAKPSAYAHLHLSPHPTRPGGGGSWEAWHEEGILEYLARVFDLPASSFYMSQPESPQPHHRATAGALIVPGAGLNSWDMMGTAQVQMQAEFDVSGGGSTSISTSTSGVLANMGCWNPSPPPPSNISVPSFYSMTTMDQGDYRSEPNTEGWRTPSMMSFSTVTRDDRSMTGSNIDFDFEYGANSNN